MASELQVIPVLVAVVLVLLAIACVVPFRTRGRYRRLDRIPRSYVPIRKRDLSRSIFHHVTGELGKSLLTEPMPDVRTSEQSGWGKPGTEYEDVHFKKSVAKSHLILERAATHTHPDWKRQSSQTVREYIEMLSEVCTSLNHASCRAYVEGYEKARFSDHEFCQEEYTDFMKHFFSLINVLDGHSQSQF